MRRFSVLFAMALCLVSAVALAQNDKVTAQFESLAASGISGDVRLNPMAQQGTVKAHVQLNGLQPNTQYVLRVFEEGSCGANGGVSTELATVTANPAGKVNLNRDLSQDIADIGSISVALVSDPAVLACASIAP